MSVLTIVREYVFFVFFKIQKNVTFYVFLKWHVKKNIENVFQVSESWLCWLFSTLFIKILYGLSFRIDDNKTDWWWSSFRPETLSLYRPTIHVTTVTFFYVFLTFFFKIQKTWLFTFFCLASYVFSNYGSNQWTKKII